MYQGKIVERGAVDDIYRSPTQEYTRNLLKSIPGQRALALSN
jgi:ABC-type oligopeptide transport system ATPase subunit